MLTSWIKTRYTVYSKKLIEDQKMIVFQDGYVINTSLREVTLLEGKEVYEGDITPLLEGTKTLRKLLQSRELKPKK